MSNSATPWTVAYQAPPSVGFSRQEYWSGLPFPSPGDLPNPRIEPGSSTLQADALPSEPIGKLSITCILLAKMMEIAAVISVLSFCHSVSGLSFLKSIELILLLLKLRVCVF